MLLHEVHIEAVTGAPEKIAIEGDKKTITYKELDKQSSLIACLIQQSGCATNSKIGVLIDKSIEAVIAFIGIMKAGCSYIPLDVSAPVARLEYIIEDAGVNFIISDNKRQVLLETISKACPLSTHLLIDYNDTLHIVSSKENMQLVEDIDSIGIESSFANAIDENQPAYILYTSGSTGNPKGVVLSHRNAISFVNWAYEYFGIGRNDVLSSHAPFYFDLSIFDIYVALRAGAKLSLVPKAVSSFPVSLGKFISDSEISTWYSVPSVLVNLCIHGKLEELHLNGLKRIIYAGEAFPVKYLKEIMRKFPHVEFYNLYGPTETNVITYYKITEKPDQITEDIPIGYACPYSEIKVITNEGREARPGERGELIARGESLMLGYMNKPEMTDSAIKSVEMLGISEGKYYFTGDIVSVLENGAYRFVGRKDHMVKVRGFRVELEEIEAVLLKHEDVNECLVQYIKENEALRAIVQTQKALKKDEIIKFLKQHLPEYMIPYDIHYVNDFDRNSRGKIDRKVQYI